MSDENLNKEFFNKNNPFKTPEGYFEDFNSRLFLKIENEPHVIKVNFWNSWKYKVAIASSVAIFIVLSFSAYQFISKQNIDNKNIANVVEDKDIDTELSFFDENHLIDAITSSEKEQKLEGDDIINYLVNDNIKENAIAEAY